LVLVLQDYGSGFQDLGLVFQDISLGFSGCRFGLSLDVGSEPLRLVDVFLRISEK